MKLIDILGVEFDNIDIAEAVERSLVAMDEYRAAYVLALDSQQTIQSRKSRGIMSVLYDALLILPADKGIFAASKLLGMPLNYKMSALDYASALMARMSDFGGRVFILTAVPGVVQRAADDLSYRFPGIHIVGAQDISYIEDSQLVEEINSSQADLLLLSMDYYEQMRLIYAIGSGLDVGLILGLGRAMDPYIARRGSGGFFRQLVSEPSRALKEPRIILAALRKRIIG